MALFHANHALTQGSLHYRLATLGYQKRNAYSVDSNYLHAKMSRMTKHDVWKHNATPLILACNLSLNMQSFGAKRMMDTPGYLNNLGTNSLK